MKLLDGIKEAQLYEKLKNDKVQCQVCPRTCKLSDSQSGFCGVRMNQEGTLYTLNYAKGILPTKESIETEAVFHFLPGSPVLSVGNIGCNLNCDFCQNWETSQIEYLDEANVFPFTPEQVVQTALDRDIPVICWTYNDPVVWYEFVMETARLAKDAGLINLFKSAMFIQPETVKNLCEVIDIFSISVKSFSNKFYTKWTRAWMKPVLEATKYVYEQGKHVEISNLMVTDLNTQTEDAGAIAHWVKDELSEEVPLHYVAFHPAFKYTDVPRTPMKDMELARQAALDIGIKYCYLGNVYDSEHTHTYCTDCGHRLVERYGLKAEIVGITPHNHCSECGAKSPIAMLDYQMPEKKEAGVLAATTEQTVFKRFKWNGDINGVHVEMINETNEPGRVYHQKLGDVDPEKQETILKENERWRFSVIKSDQKDTGIEIEYPERFKVSLYELYDRAHFPTSQSVYGPEDKKRVSESLKP